MIARIVDFSVRDRGPGVPDTLRDSVFNRFVTIPNGGAGGMGTGLGLAIARSVAQMHGGSVEVKIWGFVANPGASHLPRRPQNVATTNIEHITYIYVQKDMLKMHFGGKILKKRHVNIAVSQF